MTENKVFIIFCYYTVLYIILASILKSVRSDISDISFVIGYCLFVVLGMLKDIINFSKDF